MVPTSAPSVVSRMGRGHTAPAALHHRAAAARQLTAAQWGRPPLSTPSAEPHSYFISPTTRSIGVGIRRSGEACFTSPLTWLITSRCGWMFLGTKETTWTSGQDGIEHDQLPHQFVLSAVREMGREGYVALGSTPNKNNKTYTMFSRSYMLKKLETMAKYAVYYRYAYKTLAATF